MMKRLLALILLFAVSTVFAVDIEIVPGVGDTLTIGQNDTNSRVKIAEAPTSYLRGFWPEYRDGTSVVIQAGEGWIGSGKYCTVLTVTTQALTSLSTGIENHYMYFDSSASTVTNAVFYDSTTTSTTWNGVSHLNSTNLEDRLAWSIYSWSNSATISEFIMAGDDMIYLTNDVNMTAFRCGFLMNPNNFWQEPVDNGDGGAIKSTAPRLPVNASHALIQYGNNRTVSGIVTFVYPKEMTNSFPNSVSITAGSFVKAFGFFERNAQFTAEWFPVLESREFFIRGSDAGLNSQALTINGVRQRR